MMMEMEEKKDGEGVEGEFDGGNWNEEERDEEGQFNTRKMREDKKLS